MKTLSKNKLVPTPHRRISLWDMIQFYAGDFELLQRLKSIRHTLTVLKDGNPAGIPDERKRVQLVRVLTELSHLWVKIDLIGDLEMTQDVIHHLKNTPYKNYSEVTEALGMIISKTQTELEALSFACIPINKDRFFEQSELFGKTVKEAASEEINSEIKAAGNCLAAELNTAAVFHSIRAAERGARSSASERRSRTISDMGRSLRASLAVSMRLIICVN
jgi:hypothetical protein